MFYFVEESTGVVMSTAPRSSPKPSLTKVRCRALKPLSMTGDCGALRCGGWRPASSGIMFGVSMNLQTPGLSLLRLAETE